MLHDASFLPLLRSSLPDAGESALSRPFVAGDADIGPGGDLLVVFGQPPNGGGGRPDGWRLFTAADASKERVSLEGVEFIARNHLSARDGRPGWTLVESVVGQWLERHGDLAAADSLDPAVWDEARERLGSEILVAALPACDTLICAREGLAGVLKVLAGLRHAAAGEQALTPDLYLIHDGEVQPYARSAGPDSSDSANSAPISEPNADATPAPPPPPRQSDPPARTRESEPAASNGPPPPPPPPTATSGEPWTRDDNTAVFTITAESPDDVRTQMDDLIGEHLRPLCETDWFGGVLVFEINAFVFDDTPSNREALHDIMDAANEKAGWGELAPPAGDKVSVRLRLIA